MYTYTCIYIYIHVIICIHMYVNIHTYSHTHIWIYIYLTFKCARAHARVLVGMGGWVDAFAGLCVCESVTACVQNSAHLNDKVSSWSSDDWVRDIGYTGSVYVCVTHIHMHINDKLLCEYVYHHELSSWCCMHRLCIYMCSRQTFMWIYLLIYIHTCLTTFWVFRGLLLRYRG